MCQSQETLAGADPAATAARDAQVRADRARRTPPPPLGRAPHRSTARLAEPFGATTSPPPNPLDKNLVFFAPAIANPPLLGLATLSLESS